MVTAIASDPEAGDLMPGPGDIANRGLNGQEWEAGCKSRIPLRHGNDIPCSKLTDPILSFCGSIIVKPFDGVGRGVGERSQPAPAMRVR
jgi:hypothetical protein